MPEVIDLLSDSPEPELPNNKINKIATKVTVKKSNAFFAELIESSDSITDTAPIPSKSASHGRAGVNNAKRLSTAVCNDGTDIPVLSDDFDTTLGSVLDKPSQKSSTEWSGRPNTHGSQKVDKDVRNQYDPDDPFISSPPIAKRRRLSPASGAPRTTAVFNRTVSDVIPSIAQGSRTNNGGKLQRSKTIAHVPTSDPLICTSSPARLNAIQKQPQKKSPVWNNDDIDVEILHEKAQDVSRGTMGSARNFDDEDILALDDSDDEFPSIENLMAMPPRKKYQLPSRREDRVAEDGYAGEIVIEKHTRDKSEQAQDRAQKAKDKKIAQEQEREQKRIDKAIAQAEKAREKEKARDLAKVNIDRTKPEVSIHEMTVLLPERFDAKLKGFIIESLREPDCKYSFWESPSRLVVKWNRTMKSRFNSEMDIWEPIRPETKEEKHILIYISAQDFVDLAIKTNGEDEFDLHILQLKTQFESYSIIYMIEGLTAWRNNNRNNSNRQYQAAVRSRISQDVPAVSQRNGNPSQNSYIDADGPIEDALLNLQLLHGVYIHHTAKPLDTAKWIAKFTLHLSTIPYKAQQESSEAAFCMMTGQIKPGIDAADTFVKMLGEIHRVTPNMAQGIAGEYPTPQLLLKAFKEHGPSVLTDCRKTRNKDGGLTDTAIGQAISKRIYKVFMGLDSKSLDV